MTNKKNKTEKYKKIKYGTNELSYERETDSQT